MSFGDKPLVINQTQSKSKARGWALKEELRKPDETARELFLPNSVGTGSFPKESGQLENSYSSADQVPC